MRHLHGLGLTVALAALTAAAACGDDDGGPTTPPVTAALSTHDVSVLFPLPKSEAEMALLWRLDDAGRGGPLVPAAALDVLPQVGDVPRSITGLQPEDERPLMRVVSLRVDPCFRGTERSACTPQLRLVFQAVAIDAPTGGTLPGAGGDEPIVLTMDGTVHAFYSFDAAAFAEVVAELEALADLAPENVGVTALGVSPALAAQGLDGAYARGLRALVLRHCGEGNLSRVAFMMARAFNAWTFGAIERDDDGWHLIPLADTLASHEDLEVEPTQVGGQAPSFEYTAAPNLLGVGLDPALSSDVIRGLDAAARATFFDQLALTVDPDALRPDDASCLACHITPHATDVVLELDPRLADPTWAPRLRHTIDQDPTNLRMFGYFGATPIVSQRVANDTRTTLATLTAP